MERDGTCTGVNSSLSCITANNDSGHCELSLSKVHLSICKETESMPDEITNVPLSTLDQSELNAVDQDISKKSCINTEVDEEFCNCVSAGTEKDPSSCNISIDTNMSGNIELVNLENVESSTENHHGEDTFKELVFAVYDQTKVTDSPHDSCNVVKIENSLEMGAISATTLDADDNTTQIRFSPCDLSNEPTVPQNFSVEAETIESKCPNMKKDLLNEISYSLPYNESSNVDINSSSSNFPQAENHDCSHSTYSGNPDETDHFSSVLEESSLDSGIASLDDQEQASISSPLIDNDSKTSKQPTTNQSCSMSCRKRSFLSCMPEFTESKKIKESLKRNVSFKGVTIYYFPRRQSFVTVPSQGGSTLGMGLQHTHSKQLTLTQHKRAVACHRRQVVKEYKQQQEVEEKLKQLRQSHPDLDYNQLMMMLTDDDSEDSSESSDDCCEEEGDYLTDDSQDNDDDEEDCYFLQPIPTKKRRLLLRMAGVQRIDAEEKLENKLTRESREICGCDCEGICLPAHCQCALAGIPCQVDRESFPCGCVESGCHNGSGRVEFDSDRVRTHYFQTMRRLRFEETGTLTSSSEPVKRPNPLASPYVLSSAVESNQEEATIEASIADRSFPINTESEYFQLQNSGMSLTSLPSNQSTYIPPSLSESWSLSCNNDSLFDSSNTYECGVQHRTDEPLSGSYMESYETIQSVHSNTIQNISPSDQNPASIISKQNGFDYLVPQPVSCATSVHSFDTSFGGISSEFSPSQPLGSSDLSLATNLFPDTSFYSNDSFSNSKQTFKLDPIASFLPLSNSSQKSTSQESKATSDLSPSSHQFQVFSPTINQPSTTASCSNVFTANSSCSDVQSSSPLCPSLNECGQEPTAKA